MRKGWQQKTVGEICDVVNGGTPKTSVTDYWDGRHLWITPAEMGKRSSPYASDTERKLTDRGLADSSARMLPPFSIILSSRAPIGHLVINTQPMATNQGCKGLVPGSLIDHKFLFYYLGSIVTLLNELGTGATFKELSGGKLKEVPVLVPPLTEQKRIVAILDEAFEGIAVAVANAERNLANARELFEVYLNSVFSQKGEGWVTMGLEEVGRLQTGTTPKTSEKENLGTYIPFIKPGDFRPDGSLDYENEGLSELGLAQSRLIPSGSALMVCIGATIGKAGFAARDISANQQVNAVTPLDGISGKFIYYQMISTRFQGEVIANSAQATLPIINKSKWGKLSISLPKRFAEQQRIVSRIDNLSVEIRRLENIYQQKLSALAELKQSVLQKAFAGELTAQPEKALA